MRTLLARLTTAAVIIPVFVGALFWLPNRYWTLFLLPVLLIGGWEWAALAGYNRTSRWLFGGIMLMSVLPMLFIVFGLDGILLASEVPSEGLLYAVAMVFWVVIAPMWLGTRWRARNPLLLGVVGWIVLVPTWLALVRLQAQPLDLLVLLCVVWIADTGAYFAGSRFGTRKLAPEISPGKTWEGVMGAFVSIAVYYFLLRSIFAPWLAWVGEPVGIVLFAVITVMSIEGDLFESWMKRSAGVKDSGSILPGHGGVLDRIDGLTAAMPIAALISLVYRGQA